MALRWFGGFLLLVLLGQSNCQGPPKVTGSYKAIGEMVETLEDESKLLTQVAFEESFDSETRNAAFSVWIMGMNVTFVEDFKTNQTFRYNGTDCELLTMQEWVKTKSPPSLLAYEDANGTVRFSLKQLFSLSDNLLKIRNVSDVFRGIPARKWMYEVRGVEPDTGDSRVLSVYAYWSVPSWGTTSNQASVPLGYIVSKMTYSKKVKNRVALHEQFINVYSFVPGAIHHKLFEPIQGVECIGRAPSVAFPDVNKLTALAVHSEVVFPDYLEIKYVDTWLDTKNKLFRQDMERIKDEEPGSLEKSLKYQSEIAIPKMGVVFKVGYKKGMFACLVIPIKDFEFDIQSLFNFKIPEKDWQIGKIFGLNETKYVYTGKTSKRGIPCHMFQGIRKDWPNPEANVTSIWDWCFSFNLTQKEKGVLFRNGEYGLVNAQVKILESGSPGDFPPDFRLVHHFYHVNAKDPGLMDATNFDISRCFEENEKRYLQFRVNWAVNKDSLPQIENATSDVIFLQKWKEAIYSNTGLAPHSLRVTQVRSVVDEKSLYVKFVLLAPHDGLPDDIKKAEKTGFEAERMLRDKVNTGSVSIDYIPTKGAKAMNLGVVKHSVEFQISKDFQPHTAAPTTPRPVTTRPPFTFSLITDPGDDKTTPSGLFTTSKKPDGSSTNPGTGTTPKGGGSTTPKGGRSTTPKDRVSPTPTKKVDLDDVNLAGHGPATVAGVSIAMLLVGITMGSAGIFVKYNGMPKCLNRT